MFGRYVKVFSILLPCYFLIVVVFEGYEGAAVRVCSCIAREHVNDYVCRVGRYPLPCKRYPTVITTSSPYLHAYGSCRYAGTVGSPACAAQTGLGSPKRGCCMRNRVLVSSPPNPAFLTASPAYVSEASLAGEWELRFYPDGPWEEMSALVAGSRETSADEVSVFLVALKELCRSPARPSLSVNTVRSPICASFPPVNSTEASAGSLGDTEVYAFSASGVAIEATTLFCIVRRIRNGFSARQSPVHARFRGASVTGEALSTSHLRAGRHSVFCDRAFPTMAKKKNWEIHSDPQNAAYRRRSRATLTANKGQ